MSYVADYIFRQERLPVLTLWQPWASVMMPYANGRPPDKIHETRGWGAPENLVGKWWAIHAAKRPARRTDMSKMAYEIAVKRFIDIKMLPCGLILGVGRLAECWYTGDGHAVRIGTAPQIKALNESDFELGNYNAGRYAWRFELMTALDIPLVFKGGQGIRYAPADLKGKIITLLP